MTAVRVSGEVADAVAAGRPVVALESTIIAHGLPRPRNLDVARQFERVLRDVGVIPALAAIIDGVARIGLDDAELTRIATDPDVAKCSVRDLPVAAALGRTGATTVASTAHLAALAGVRVLATGGLGGVHRGAGESFDESADLAVLARTPIVVVASGVKSILDVPATVERLETLGVTVLGYRTDAFPNFYLRDSGLPVDWRIETADDVARIRRAADALRVDAATLVANPVDAAHQLDRELHDRTLSDALAAAARDRVRGKASTPYLLDHFHRATAGASLKVNVALALANVALAAQIAVALAG